LGSLYALTRIQIDLGTFRDYDYISSTQAQLLRKEIINLCSILKDQAVSLVDAVAPPDWVLYSPIGRSDGQVYKHLYDHVMYNQPRFGYAPWLAPGNRVIEPKSKRHIFDKIKI